MKKLFLFFTFPFLLLSCSDDDNGNANPTEPQLIIKFKFDSNQERLNNIGQPSTIPSGNAAQSPDFRKISAHYFELAPNAYTQLGEGAVLYHAPETNAGGETAIDFSQAIIVSENETFLSIPLSAIPNGNYQYVRVSLSYQNYGIKVLANGTEYNGTIDSFVGYNTYITTHYIGNNSFPVNDNRLQGYWAFALDNYPFSTSGQAVGTTVPNPIAATSPIPQGSCVVTGAFSENLTLNGNETQNIEITLSLSINKSFEWQEVNFDGKYEPAAGETVVDMGLRGLKPSFVK
ncbi:hypothetical protein [Flavobacterium sp.]|uniref:hypothetical protein n=1 Tax=Flavobacterium sp. TaxID=239 RepID=UPI0035282B62